MGKDWEGRCFDPFESTVTSFVFDKHVENHEKTVQWLRRSVTNRKVAGSILNGVIGILH